MIMMNDLQRFDEPDMPDTDELKLLHGNAREKRKTVHHH